MRTRYVLIRSIDSRNSDGFTLIELLVIIMIIAILAAIALPIFLGQRAKAFDTHAKSWAVTAQKALEIWHMEHNGFSTVTVADLLTIEPSLANATDLEVDVSGDASTYVLTVASMAAENGGGPFHIRRTPTTTDHVCDSPGHGSCRDDGTW